MSHPTGQLGAPSGLEKLALWKCAFIFIFVAVLVGLLAAHSVKYPPSVFSPHYANTQSKLSSSEDDGDFHTQVVNVLGIIRTDAYVIVYVNWYSV